MGGGGGGGGADFLNPSLLKFEELSFKTIELVEKVFNTKNLETEFSEQYIKTCGL